MNGSRGKLTQPLRPVGRYRPGKVPVPIVSDDESDEEEQQQEAEGEDGADEVEADKQVQEFSTTRRDAATTGRFNVALREVEVDKAGKVKVGGKDEVGRTEMESSEGEYETESEDQRAAAPTKPTFRSQAPAVADEEESSEYETDSEEEEPLKPIYKPVFVSKRNRDTLAEKKEFDAEALEAQREAEEKKRREEAKVLVAESIVREISTKEAEESHPDVDDTDGLDPEGEFEAWKLRELMRLKRDREARYALEKIREEVEARRALPEELRLKEDLERADKTRKEKKKGQQVFLQKYHHKGVFHQDLDILKKHDYTAPTASTITDVSSLPAVMQKRNFGKAHQTKYTHLAAEDTSRTSGGWGKLSGPGGGAGGGKEGGCFLCGGPHLKRDCPQLAEGASTSASASGANSSAAQTGGDAGWAARRPPPPSDDRFAPGGGGGRRGGIGYGRGEEDRRGGGVERRRSRSRERRDRSRSPPVYRDYDWEDGRGKDRYGGRRDEDYSRSSGSRRDDRDRDYRRRSRSRSRSPDRGDRGGYGGRHRDERDRWDRDDKRRRLDY
ncbi:hypothetical protein JCM10295v2_005511 [Rhodotorula toruloides]